MTTAGPNVNKQPVSPTWCSRTVILGKKQLKMVEIANINQYNKSIYPQEYQWVRGMNMWALFTSHPKSCAKNSSQ